MTEYLLRALFVLDEIKIDLICERNRINSSIFGVFSRNQKQVIKLNSLINNIDTTAVLLHSHLATLKKNEETEASTRGEE